jgi:hypothetical protein
MLRSIGIFIVVGGELERFHPEQSSDNKAEWLREVLENSKHLQAVDARDFLKAITTNVLSRQ